MSSKQRNDVRVVRVDAARAQPCVTRRWRSSNSNTTGSTPSPTGPLPSRPPAHD
jgi:hypothetical protein